MGTKKLVFTEEEWNAAARLAVKDITSFVSRYRVAIIKHCGDDGAGWGSGSFLALGDEIYILTNEHVARAARQGERLIHLVNGREDFHPIHGYHSYFEEPFDLALLPVQMDAWRNDANQSQAIKIDQIDLAHAPVEGEILCAVGFAGERVKFFFNTVFSESTCSAAREVALPDDPRYDSQFHFGLDYRPDLAENIIGKKGLPLPPGLSGSTVWNTRFVEAKMKGIQWKPELATVTGVVWGWPSSNACLVATRSEYVRSFLLDAPVFRNRVVGNDDDC